MLPRESGSMGVPGHASSSLRRCAFSLMHASLAAAAASIAWAQHTCEAGPDSGSQGTLGDMHVSSEQHWSGTHVHINTNVDASVSDTPQGSSCGRYTTLTVHCNSRVAHQAPLHD